MAKMQLLATCKVPVQKPGMRSGTVRLGKCVDPAVTTVLAFKAANMPGILKVKRGESVAVCARHAVIIRGMRFA